MQYKYINNATEMVNNNNDDNSQFNKQSAI